MASDNDFRPPGNIPVPEILILGSIGLFYGVLQKPEVAILDFTMASNIHFRQLGVMPVINIPISQIYSYSRLFGCILMFSKNRKPPFWISKLRWRSLSGI